MAARITGTITTMTDASLIRLMSWLSPVFPTGSFAYSAGLEQAVAQKTIGNVDDLEEWLTTILSRGSLKNEAILFAASWRDHKKTDAVAELAQLCSALAGSAERHRETLDQGKAFAEAANHWFSGADKLPTSLPLPVAVGVACGQAGIAIEPALGAYLNTFAANHLQCAIRLSVTGQNGAARLLFRLEPVVAKAAILAARSSEDDLGSCAIAVEIASMNHETLEPRMFLS